MAPIQVLDQVPAFRGSQDVDLGLKGNVSSSRRRAEADSPCERYSEYFELESANAQSENTSADQETRATDETRQEIAGKDRKRCPRCEQESASRRNQRRSPEAQTRCNANKYGCQGAAKTHCGDHPERTLHQIQATGNPDGTDQAGRPRDRMQRVVLSQCRSDPESEENMRKPNRRPEKK